MKPTHYRAIARAAPLCYAYDLDLALVGFPTEDLDLIVKETITETNIGRGGKLLEVLNRLSQGIGGSPGISTGKSAVA